MPCRTGHGRWRNCLPSCFDRAKGLIRPSATFSTSGEGRGVTASPLLNLGGDGHPSPFSLQGEGARRADEAPAFGLYIHWPFCKAKCPYCDFNSHVRHQDVDSLGFAKTLVSELEFMAARTPGREVSSIFFGGGTPSLMPPAAVALVLDAAAELWPAGQRSSPVCGSESVIETSARPC